MLKRNIKLTIEYDGTGYAGWQTQKKQKTIQETIEIVLKKILGEKIRLVASGRTDAGVHALGQTANFKTKNNIPISNLKKALNSILPHDIVISKADEMQLSFHGRFDVKTKTYRYCILNRDYPSVFLKNRVYFFPHRLNVKLMQNEARYLEGRHDFKSFCSSGSSVTDTVRTIKKIAIKKSACECIIIDIEADGFLYNMARSIAGTLIEIGRGKMPPQSVRKILKAKNRVCAGPTAPAKGLCLMEVKY